MRGSLILGGATEEVDNGTLWKGSMIGRLYKRLLVKIHKRNLSFAQNSEATISAIRFDNFGRSIELVCRLLFYSSDIYIGGSLVGYFYGRSLGFWGATNCTCYFGAERIRFKDVKEGVCVFNVLTREKLLLRRPDNKFASRVKGKIRVCLANDLRMTIEPPRLIFLSQAGLPAYARFIFEDGTIVRVLLYGRGPASWEMETGRFFDRAIHPDDVGNLLNLQSRISVSMFLSLAMYLRMYMHTRWLVW